MIHIDTPVDKLRKAITEANNMGFDDIGKPITLTFNLDEPAYIDDPRFKKPPLGIKPFELWVEQRQEELWEAIKRSEHYPEHLISEWSFLDSMLREWKEEKEWR